MTVPPVRSSRLRRALLPLSVLLLVAAAAGSVIFLRLDRRVRDAASPERLAEKRERPLSFSAVPERRYEGAVLQGDGSVSGVVALPDGLLVAGGSGLHFARGDSPSLDVREGFPTLRLSAAAAWRGTPVLAFERGGWGRLVSSRYEEARTGWGLLHVRTFLETPGGELLLGAREGLFRAAFGSTTLERLSTKPVRALTLVESDIAFGGEQGLFLLSGSGEPVSVGTPDPWIESLGSEGRTHWAATPVGIALGTLAVLAPPRPPALALHPRGGEGVAGAFVSGRFHARTPGGESVLALAADGGSRVTSAPEPFTRLFAASGRLFGASASGLFTEDPDGRWRRVWTRPPASLPLPHVNALAISGNTLWAGFFEGGLATATLTGGDVRLNTIPGDALFGVNAVLPAGDALYVASLRGAFRIEGAGQKPVPLEGAGAAFSLALLPSGLAVGYGQGVALPGPRLLSAFHGLPGNQAYALAQGGDALWVGTPSGLGRLEGSKVTQRTTTGDGVLPHPWVTALVTVPGGVLVGTYGGGVALVTLSAGRLASTRLSGGDGRARDTGGLKVNAGAMLLDAEGRLWVGTEGQGLFRSDRSLRDLSHVDLPLPSPSVYALAVSPVNRSSRLFIGTSEGLVSLPLSSLENP